MASQAAPCMGRSELGKERPRPLENGEPEIKTRKARQWDGGQEAKVCDVMSFLRENIGTVGTEAASTVRGLTRNRMPI